MLRAPEFRATAPVISRVVGRASRKRTFKRIIVSHLLLAWLPISRLFSQTNTKGRVKVVVDIFNETDT